MSLGFIFGPVPSRRLGLSLGINIVPFKTCSFNCIYCEVGKTTDLTVKRKSFYDVDEIKKDFVETVDKSGHIDFVTFSGSGEPTLNSDIGELIDFVKSFNKYKIAVLTNGSLMYKESVRKDLINADVVVPSLDAALSGVFKKVNLPHKDLEIDKIIDGLFKFKKEFKGQVWLEILFVEGVNDSEENLNALIEAVNRISPDIVQIGTVDRPPAYSSAHKVNDEKMMDIYTYLSAHLKMKVDIIGSFNKENDKFYDNIERSIIKMVNIRPCSKDELKSIFNLNDESIKETLDKLIGEEKIYTEEFQSKLFVVGNRSVSMKK